MNRRVGRPRIAVIGAGLIGRRHIEAIVRTATLAAIVDPSPSAAKLAQSTGANWHADLETYLRTDTPDGIVVATPNRLHFEQALIGIEAGIPLLIEKPIADTAMAGGKIVVAAERAGVPVLVGHHRRHNPIIRVARQAIDSGTLGDIISVVGQFWLYKPDSYFETDWRTRQGAGPVFINLIHDIDSIRYLCGEIVSVQAAESQHTRGHEVEDTAAILLVFESGALGTIAMSDTIVAPWSWEFTARENPAYPAVDAHCYRIGGSRASLSIPDLELWFHPGERGWWEPIEHRKLACKAEDSLTVQMLHFVDVIESAATPVVSGREGVRSLQVIEAIKRAAATGRPQDLPTGAGG